MKIRVKTSDIDYCVVKRDATIFYMKSGKVWVCSSYTEENNQWTILTLKGKCGK